MVVTRHVVAQKTDLWRVAIRYPKIQIPVPVPIDLYDRSPIVFEIEMRGGRNIGKTGTARIEKTTVSFVPAERSALTYQVEQGV